MGKLSRTKGHTFEREVAVLFKPLYPGAKRGIGQARDAREVADVEGVPFWVECKRGKKVNIKGAFRQAEDARDDRPTLVVSRDDHGPPLATMHLLTFLAVLEKCGAEKLFWEGDEQ